jgi:hypothetical protein
MYAARTVVRTKPLSVIMDQYKVTGSWWERRIINFGHYTSYLDQLAKLTGDTFYIQEVRDHPSLPYIARSVSSGIRYYLGEEMIDYAVMSIVKFEVSFDEILKAREKRQAAIKAKNKKTINDRNIPR